MLDTDLNQFARYDTVFSNNENYFCHIPCITMQAISVRIDQVEVEKTVI